MTDHTRYPLVNKALGEQHGIFAAATDGVPDDLVAATTRALTLIDTHVNTSDDVKEAILTVCVLMHCPPYMALRSNRFAQDYNAHVQAMLDTHTKSAGVTAANTDLVQVYSAMFIAHAENLQSTIKATDKPDLDWLRDIRHSLTNFAEDRTAYEHGIAKPLRKLEDQMIRATLATIDAAIAAQTPVKKPVVKKGPPPPKSR